MLAKAGQWILKSPRHAWIAAGLLAPLPLLGWVSAVILALVTLRRGVFAGLWVLVIASLPFVIWLSTHSDLSLLLYLKCISLVAVWLFAAMLRGVRRWYPVVMGMTVLGMLSVAVVYSLIGDPAAFWLQRFSDTLQHFVTLAEGNDMPLLSMVVGYYQQMLAEPRLLAAIASVATGLLVMNTIISVFIQLLMARYWQAQCFYPQGLKRELYEFQLPVRDAIMLVIVAAGILFNVALFVDLLPVVILPFLLAGFCLAHRYFKKRQWSQATFYAFALVMALLTPYSLLALVGVAVIDSVYDLKGRMGLDRI